MEFTTRELLIRVTSFITILASILFVIFGILLHPKILIYIIAIVLGIVYIEEFVELMLEGDRHTAIRYVELSYIAGLIVMYFMHIN